MKRILKFVVLLFALVILCGCGKNDAKGGETLVCTLEIRCDTLLDKLDQMAPEKAALVPEDGVLLPVTEVEFTEGESVLDVLRRTLREKKIHFEYVDATAYETAYIEGIGNLYEFDCGAQSGWVYQVNGVHMGVGCSAYTLADSDAIVFHYTCDLGIDVGSENDNG